MRLNGNGHAPKPKRRERRPAHVPLFMLRSDGEVYACVLASAVAEEFRRAPDLVLAVRLSRKERAQALDAIQPGIADGARIVARIPKPGPCPPDGPAGSRRRRGRAMLDRGWFSVLVIGGITSKLRWPSEPGQRPSTEASGAPSAAPVDERQLDLFAWQPKPRGDGPEGSQT